MRRIPHSAGRVRRGVGPRRTRPPPTPTSRRGSPRVAAGRGWWRRPGGWSRAALLLTSTDWTGGAATMNGAHLALTPATAAGRCAGFTLLVGAAGCAGRGGSPRRKLHQLVLMGTHPAAELTAAGPAPLRHRRDRGRAPDAAAPSPAWLPLLSPHPQTENPSHRCPSRRSAGPPRHPSHEEARRDRCR